MLQGSQESRLTVVGQQGRMGLGGSKQTLAEDEASVCSDGQSLYLRFKIALDKTVPE